MLCHCPLRVNCRCGVARAVLALLFSCSLRLVTFPRADAHHHGSYWCRGTGGMLAGADAVLLQVLLLLPPNRPPATSGGSKPTEPHAKDGAYCLQGGARAVSRCG